MQAETESYMDENSVKEYLKDHPEFFEHNAQLLADIHLPSPHGNGTISLAERQQLAQRDKISVLETRFDELINNAQFNNLTAAKIHHVNLNLHKAKNFDAIEQLVSHDLPEIFELTDTCLKVWAKPISDSNHANLVFSEVSIEVKDWVGKLNQPYCGAPSDMVAQNWFIEPPGSLSIIALRNPDVIGFLALASDDEKRFYTSMGTDFLTSIGELVSAALSRYVETNSQS